MPGRKNKFRAGEWRRLEMANQRMCAESANCSPGPSVRSCNGTRAPSPEPSLLHAIELVMQRLQTDPEQLCRARLVAARVIERDLDQLAFGLIDRGAGDETGGR